MEARPPLDEGPQDDRLASIASALVEVGITGPLAEAYAGLVSAGPLTAAGLGRTLGCARSHAYRVAKALVEEGLAAATMERPVRYKATPPERVARLLDARDARDFALRRRRRRELTAILEEMSAGPEGHAHAPLFRIIEGKTQRADTLMILVAEAHRKVHLCTTLVDDHEAWARGGIWTILGDATAASLRRRVLLPDTQEVRGGLMASPPPDGVDVRLAKPPVTVSFVTADGAAAIIARSTTGARRVDEVALWTTALGVVHACDLLFCSLWSQARPWQDGG